MLTLPNTVGWSVDVETDEVSKRTGKKLWKEVFCTSDKNLLNEKVKELKKQGYNVRVFESIF
jgi:hypothetical protein